MLRLKEGPVLLAMCVLFLCLQISGYMTINALVDDGLTKLDYKLSWTLFMFTAYPAGAYYVYCALFQNKPVRVFTLKSVKLLTHSGLGLHREKFMFDDISWYIGKNVTEFFIDLEDTGAVYNTLTGCETDCKPRFLSSIKTHEQFSEQDMLKITLNNDGTVYVRYLGQPMTIAEVQWDLSEPFTPVTNLVRKQSEEERTND